MSNYKPRIETNNLDLTSILSTINELPEASKGASIDVITASSLPATVVENQIVVITDTTPSTIYVDTDEPANPVSGDVWVKVGSSDYGVEFSETFRNGFNEAKQFNNDEWAGLIGYIGLSGAWMQFADALPPKGTPLEDWTWAEIITLANSGVDVREYFAVGDTKNLILSTGEVATVVIGDFYHNNIEGTSTNAAFAFTFKNCLNTTCAMNPSSGDNWDGWLDSYMRKTHMVNIFNTFPAELKADGAIKIVSVVANAGGETSSLETSYDRLRLHSLKELGLSASWVSVEGTTYAYYTSGHRFKTINGADGIYWTRSAYTSNDAWYATVNTSGLSSYADANRSHGVAPCFDI